MTGDSEPLFGQALSTDKINFYESFLFDGFVAYELALTTNRIAKWIGGIQGCGSS